MPYGIEDQTLAEIEAFAVEIAAEAGKILSRHFGQSLKIEYKDKRESDPVTDADHESQSFLVEAITKRFPEHGILGEEDDEEKQEDTSPAPDFLWVLDPLDGTKNFLHGLPIYASSIGVLYKGAPVVGAVFTPWPSDTGGVVLHARKGGGAFAGDEPVAVLDTEPQGNTLVTLPASFGVTHRFRGPLRRTMFDLRVTGSIAYELVLVARGATHYMVTTRPHLWDIAGGVMIVMEAGGVLMRGARSSGLLDLFPSIKWQETETLVPDWQSGVTSIKDLRSWASPLTLAGPDTARLVADNMQAHLNLRWWVRRKWRSLRAGS
jgi:myo-inositol-1(or 4)-monophosphatase